MSFVLYYEKIGSECYKMDWLLDLVTNPFLVTSISSWLLAQIIKFVINIIVNKEFKLRWLFSDGGMPSGHSATVSSLAFFSLLTYGPGSFQFGVTMILAMIVTHDATGVRQEAGKHAVVLNEILETFELLKKKMDPEMKLKEYLGHTFIQVVAGITVGFLNALFMYFVVFN